MDGRQLRRLSRRAALRERLRELGIGPLIDHLIFVPNNHTCNDRTDELRYNRRSMAETVNSTVKRSLGFVVRARSWFREFRNIVLVCRL